MLLALLDSLSLMPLMSDQSKFSYVCVNVTFGYVLLLFVLYLIIFYRTLPHTLSPSFWYSGAYALVLAYATRTRGPLAGVWGSPPSSPLVLCIYVLLVYCVKHLLYCIVQIFCTNILP